MRDLLVSVKRSDFRGDSPHPSDSNLEFSQAKDKVKERDNYTCYYCDFKSKKYQHVHHLDDDHDNNTEENLVTACPLCHMSQHIGYAGTKGLGMLIYAEQEMFGDIELPVCQPAINHLVRLLWIQLESKDPDESKQASDYLKRFEQMRVDADKFLGTSDPILLSNKLKELSDKHYDERSKSLKHIYLIPYKEAFLKEHRYWRDVTLKHVSNQKWHQIAKANCFRWMQVYKFKEGLAGIKRLLAKFKII